MSQGRAPFLQAALMCRCPRCGKGRLFRGLLTVRDRCPVCNLGLQGHDAGDGPAVAVIFLLGTIVMALAFWVEFRFSPPLWVHVILWPAVILPLALGMMRPLKAAVIGLQYRHRASEMRL